MKNTVVSLYESIYAQSNKKVSLWDCLTTLQEKWKDKVLRMRAESDETTQNEMKKNLPCFTVSGSFSGKATKSTLEKHSGFIALDIDKKDNLSIDNFADLKNQCKYIPWVSYCGYSSRGEGFFLILPIADPSKHQAYFDCLEKVFKHFGVTLDPQCGNVNRFRYASYDSEPYINENAIAFDYVLPSKSEPRTPNTHQRIHSASAPSGSYSEFDLREFLERNNVPYTEKTYNGYVAYEVDCPWADTHTTDSPHHRDKAMVWKDPSTGFCFKCFHTHNNIPRGWKDFRRVVELQSDFGDLHI